MKPNALPYQFYILYLLSFGFMLCSCKTYEVMKVKEEYSNQPLYMDEIFIVNCKRGDCNTNFTDSLSIIMKESFNDLGLDINYKNTLNNVYNDTVWVDTVPPKFYAPRKVNFEYFKEYPYQNERLKIVPFLYYHEIGGYSTAHDTYTIHIIFNIFIIDDKETIYLVSSFDSKTVHYVRGLDDFKKEDIDITPLMKPIIYKALNPYIERSGNGKKIETY